MKPKAKSKTTKLSFTIELWERTEQETMRGRARCKMQSVLSPYDDDVDDGVYFTEETVDKAEAACKVRILNEIAFRIASGQIDSCPLLIEFKLTRPPFGLIIW
jgi:hypothetical protein